MEQQPPYFIPFPSIEKFSDVVDNFNRYKENHKTDKILYKGTCKIHGTHGNIVYNTKNRLFWVQSRNRIITPEHDNLEFASYVESHKEAFFGLLQLIQHIYISGGGGEKEKEHLIVIYGEYAGGNIQPRIALATLPKMFVIFNIKIDNIWVKTLHSCIRHENSHIYNICQFPIFYICIDFANPESSEEQLTEFTLQVEKECPVGKYFGIHNGLGEGIVWSPMYKFNNSKWWFKVKGKEHCMRQPPKVKLLALATPEVLDSIDRLIDESVSNNRCNQAMDYVIEYKNGNAPITVKDMGAFLKWISDDIWKEEKHLLKQSDLDEKQINKKINEKARSWFMANFQKF